LTDAGHIGGKHPGKKRLWNRVRGAGLCL